MNINKQTGLIQEARYVPSANCDERPVNTDISLLVIHGISLPPGEFGGDAIDALFTNTLNATAHPYFATIATLQVSAHAMINREGLLTQYVPLHKRAWHAGVSCFDGQERCNDFSIGIELEGCDDRAYSATQYETLQALTVALMHTYPKIVTQRIAGHSDIAPGRKTDPGPAFDWKHYLATIG